MNDVPSVTGIVAEVQGRFGNRLHAVRVSQRDEIYFDAKMDLVAGFSAHLYRNWDARLVSIFADDVRESEKVFQLYYVFALDARPRVFHPARAGAAGQTGVRLADQRHSGRQLAGTGNPGLVRPELIGHPNPGAAPCTTTGRTCIRCARISTCTRIAAVHG